MHPPLVLGVPMPADLEYNLIVHATWVMLVLEDDYDLQMPTLFDRVNAFSTIFDQASQQLYGDAYTSPGLNYWSLKAYGITVE